LSLISLDGAAGEGGGQVLRTALALSALTGQGFEMTRIRARRTSPGLLPQHLAAVRAVAMACGAKVSGAFDGSPDLRFEPGAIAAGEFRFEIGTAGAVTLVLETVLPVLGAASSASRVDVVGGTHVPLSPSYDYFARHWAPVVRGLGLEVHGQMGRAGFFPPGGGEVQARVEPWRRPAARLDLAERGRFVGIKGRSGAARVKGGAADRQRDGAQRVFWERQRLEADWEVVEVTADSPGSFLFLEAVFEKGRGAFAFLGQRGVSPEALGDRAARRLLRFIEDEEGAVDSHLADQLVVPLVAGGGGGRVSTVEVTRHLESAAEVATRFGLPVEVWGRPGGPGGLEVGRATTVAAEVT
jgi:RNA 3'-terminal phosphate cyclase (ATP)